MGTLFKGDIIQRKTLFKEIRYFEFCVLYAKLLFNTQYMRNPTMVYPFKTEYG